MEQKKMLTPEELREQRTERMKEMYRIRKERIEAMKKRQAEKKA